VTGKWVSTSPHCVCTVRANNRIVARNNLGGGKAGLRRGMSVTSMIVGMGRAHPDCLSHKARRRRNFYNKNQVKRKRKRIPQGKEKQRKY